MSSLPVQPQPPQPTRCPNPICQREAAETVCSVCKTERPEYVRVCQMRERFRMRDRAVVLIVVIVSLPCIATWWMP